MIPLADGASPRRTSLQAAWSFGLPVITTSSAIDEPNIQNGVNCLLVNQFTPQAWGTAIKSLLLDDQLRKQISLGSLSTAEIFNWESLAKLHFTIFDRLLAQP